MRSQVPPVNALGFIAPGTYPVTFATMRRSWLVHGNGEPDWDVDWRAYLLDNFESLARQIWSVGEGPIFVGGSFIDWVPHPHDVDAAFVCEFEPLLDGTLARRLNELDEHGCWSWNEEDRVAVGAHARPKLAMWAHYRVEIMPIVRENGTFSEEQSVLEIYRLQRRHLLPKGILAIEPERPTR